ncbi:MAG: hypothetical protein P4L99_13590 [Chthoniobacter sp.]|nr:hypothetical protein [Chthoniobacter sp.]
MKQFRLGAREAVNAEAERIRAELEGEAEIRDLNGTSGLPVTPRHGPLTHDQFIHILAACIRARLDGNRPDVPTSDVVHSLAFAEAFHDLAKPIGFARTLEIFTEEISKAPDNSLIALVAVGKRVNTQELGDFTVPGSPRRPLRPARGTNARRAR